MSDDDGFDQALFDLQVTLNSFHVSLPPPPLKPIDRFMRDYEDVCKERGITFNKKKASDQWYELQTSLKSDYKHLFEREFYTYERLKSMEAIINRNQKKLNAWNIFLEQEKKRYPHLKYSEYEPLLRKQWRDLRPIEQASFRDQAPKVPTIEEKKKLYEEFELLKQEYVSKSTDIPRDLEFYDKMNDVEMIIGYRKNSEGTKEYLIKWKGKSGQDATWIPKSKLRALRTMIKYYQSTYQNPDQISYSSFSDNNEVFPLYPEVDGDAKADKTKQGKGKNDKKNKKQQDQEGKQNTQSEDDDRVEINPVFGLFEKQVAPKVNKSNKKKKITKPIQQPPQNIEISSDSEDQVVEVAAQQEKGGKDKKASKQKIAPKPITKKIQKKKIETPKVLEDKKKKVETKQVQPVKTAKPAPKVAPKAQLKNVINSSSDGSQSPKVVPKVVSKVVPKVVSKVQQKQVIDSSSDESQSPKVVPKIVPKVVTKVQPKQVISSSSDESLSPKVVPKIVPKVVPKAQPKLVKVINSSSGESQSPVKQNVRRGRSKLIASSSNSPSLEVIQPTKAITKVTLKRGTKQGKQKTVEEKPQAKQARNSKAKQLTPKEIVEIVKENVQKQNKKQTKEKRKQTKEGITETKKIVQTKQIIQIKTTTRRGAHQQVQPIQKKIQKRR